MLPKKTKQKSLWCQFEETDIEFLCDFLTCDLMPCVSLWYFPSCDLMCALRLPCCVPPVVWHLLSCATVRCARRPHPEEHRLDLAALLAGLLVHAGEQDVLGGHAGVGHALPIAQHPDEHVWDAVLGLEGPPEGSHGHQDTNQTQTRIGSSHRLCEVIAPVITVRLDCPRPNSTAALDERWMTKWFYWFTGNVASVYNALCWAELLLWI